MKPTQYTVLPLVYDRWQAAYGKDYSAVILPRVLSSIRKHRIPRGAMVDVACGTGSLALLMARRGWSVWGIDASGAMLAQAWRKAARGRLPVVFLRQDMRAMRLPARVQLAVSVFDSLNHLPGPADLAAAFRSVGAALEPGGWFLFDLNNERCFTRLWTREQTLTHRSFTLLLRNSYNADTRRARSRVTILLPGRRGMTVLEETVRERCFTAEQVCRALRRGGLSPVEREDFNPTDRRGIGRIKTWWVARKPPYA